MDAILSPAVPATPFDQWTLILSFFMPLVIARINRARFKKDFKPFVAFMACITAAAVQLGVEGKLSPQNWTASALGIFALTITFFHGFWQKNGFADAIEKGNSKKPSEDIES